MPAGAKDAALHNWVHFMYHYAGRLLHWLVLAQVTAFPFSRIKLGQTHVEAELFLGI